MTTKEKEINALKALVAMDGYFAERFRGDLDTMVGNIEKDFPIEMGTSVDADIHKNEIKNLCVFLLERAQKFGDIELLKKAIELKGHAWVIRHKLQNEMPLWECDKEFILFRLA